MATNENIEVVLVGNKSDLGARYEVDNLAAESHSSAEQSMPAEPPALHRKLGKDWLQRRICFRAAYPEDNREDRGGTDRHF